MFTDPVNTYGIAFVRAGAVPNSDGQLPVEVYVDSTANIATQWTAISGTTMKFSAGTFSGVWVLWALPYKNGCVATNLLNDNTTQILSGTPSGAAIFAVPSAEHTRTIALAAGTTYANVPVAPGYNAISSGPTAAFTIDGLAGGHDGMIVYLKNLVAQQMILSNSDAGAAAGNKFIFPNAANISTSATVKKGTIALIYDKNLDSGNGAWTLLSDANIVYS